MQQGPIDIPNLFNSLNEAAARGEDDLIAIFNEIIDKDSNCENENLSYAKLIFFWAVIHDHANIVQKLLSNPRVNPSDDNVAIRVAVEVGHAEVLRVLLTDPRITTADLNSESIEVAAYNNYFEVIRVLLADSRFNPANLTDAIRAAVRQGNIEALKLLLADPRITPADLNSESIKVAAENNYFEVIRVILADPRLDPANLTDAIKAAATQGNIEVLKLLLADPRAIPPKLICFDFRIDIECLKLLLADPRVDPTCDNNELFDRALVDKRFVFIDILLDHPGILSYVSENIGHFKNSKPLHDLILLKFNKAVTNGNINVVDILLDAVMDYVSENIAQFKDNKPVLDLIFKKFLEKMSPCIAALHASGMPNEVIVNNFGPFIHPLFKHYAKCINNETKTSALSCDSLSLVQSSNKLLPIYENNKMDVIDSKERNPTKKIKVEENKENHVLEEPITKKRRTGLFGCVELF